MLTTDVQAGPELDAEMARRVFGYEVEMEADRPGSPFYWIKLRSAFGNWSPGPAYSSLIAAAWQVVDELHGDWSFALSDDAHSGEWEAAFCKVVEGERPYFSASADTAPLAICRAALKALDS